LTAETCLDNRGQKTANLFVVGDEHRQPFGVIFYCRGGTVGGRTILASARIHFGGAQIGDVLLAISACLGRVALGLIELQHQVTLPCGDGVRVDSGCG
jgi:hypothetical protein